MSYPYLQEYKKNLRSQVQWLIPVISTTPWKVEIRRITSPDKKLVRPHLN
jgi:hypothetical protein